MAEQLDWLRAEVARGLQRLMCLGLERTPAAEVVQLTAAVWVESLTKGRVWDREADSWRIAAGFSELCATRRTWPVPRDLLDALPPRAALAITKQAIRAQPERAEAAAAELGWDLRARRQA